MKCVQCKKHTAKYELINEQGLDAVFLCEECYQTARIQSKKRISACLISEHVCPDCGTTWADYIESGLLGCGGCYEYFKNELSYEIARLQGNALHTGKSVPKYDKWETVSRVLELTALQSEAQERAEVKFDAERLEELKKVAKLEREINRLKETILDGEEE